MAHDVDIKHFMEARAALAKIVRSGDDGISLNEIFGEKKSAWWSRQIVLRAQHVGLIEMLPRSHSRAKTFFKALPGLQETIRSDELMSEMLWPSESFDPNEESVSEEDDEDEDEDDIEDGGGDEESFLSDPEEPSTEATEPESVPVVDVDAPPPGDGEPDGEPSDSEMLAGIVRMVAAILENVVHTRKKVDEISERLDKIEESWS